MASYHKTQQVKPIVPVAPEVEDVWVFTLSKKEVESLKFLLNSLDSSLAPDLADLKMLITQDPEIVQKPLQIEVKEAKTVMAAPEFTPANPPPASVTTLEVP